MTSPTGNPDSPLYVVQAKLTQQESIKATDGSTRSPIKEDLKEMVSTNNGEKKISLMRQVMFDDICDGLIGSRLSEVTTEVETKDIAAAT